MTKGLPAERRTKASRRAVPTARPQQQNDRRITPNAQETRLMIVQAALKLLASDEGDSFSVKAAAQVAAVNRGTAYFHFGSREKLISEAIEYAASEIKDRLYAIEHLALDQPFSPDRIAVLEDMALFMIRNPQLCRVWMLEVFAKEGGFTDPLTQNALESMKAFSASPFGEDNVDAEVSMLMTFGAYFLWSLMLAPRNLSPAQQEKMAARVVTEVLRMSLFGLIDETCAPALAEIVRERVARK